MPLATAARHGWRRNPMSGYIVITLKGVQFLEAWYNVGHIPATLVSLYQFLVRLVWMHGRAPVNVVGNTVLVKLAQLKGYVKLTRRPARLPNGVKEQIIGMKGEAPREIYAQHHS